MLTLPHYSSLGTPRSVIKQLEIGRSSTTSTDKESTICCFLENVSHPTSALVLVKLLAFEKHFKLMYGRSASRPASVTAIPIIESCQAATSSIGTMEMDSVNTTISSDSKSAFT